MIGPVRISVLVGTALGLQGCVAAAVPVVAGSAIAGKRLIGDGDREAVAAPPIGRPVPQDVLDAAIAAGPAPVAAPVAATVPPAMQYLYGSGEAAALSLQSYMALANFLIARSSDREVGHDVPSVILAPEATLAAPVFVPCGDKPLAVVLDVDETALLNLGYEQVEARSGGGYDPQRWDRWEKTGITQVAAVPGAVEALTVARRADIAVIFNSNRSNANAVQTAAAIEGAGLGSPRHRETLFLKGDAGTGSGKDARRALIAERYCVVAMVGDQLGDFSDLFNAAGTGIAARRAAIQGRELEILWGQGWFLLPNPVYGTGLQGGFADVFPADKAWADPAGGQ